MKKSISFICLGLTALAFTGCRSVNLKESGYETTIGGAGVTSSGDVVKMQSPGRVYGAGGASSTVNQPAAKGEIARASAVLEQARVLVSALGKGGDADAHQVALLLGNGIEGTLAAANYKVVTDGPSEIIVSMDISSSPLNARGSRVVYKGDVDASVTRSPDFNRFSGRTMKDMIARNRFDVTSSPGRDRGEALKSVADKMTSVVAPWLADACLKVGGKFEVCVVTISNAWFLSPHSDYPSKFVARVLHIDGVYGCTILATDNVNKSLRARIVYDKDRFPDGVINRLYTIPELNIHR